MGGWDIAQCMGCYHTQVPSSAIDRSCHVAFEGTSVPVGESVGESVKPNE